MKNNSDLKLNIIVVLFSQIPMIFANFFTKQAILLYLSAEYMGLQTVCANFCDMLSMAFTATGMVMLFRLYKPLEDNDEAKISSVFFYFKKLYCFLTIGTILIGTVFSGITLLCVNMSISMGMILLYYWLYLLGVLCYNYFLYNYYFLMADQKRYVSAAICGTIDIVALIFEVWAIATTKMYSLFLILIALKNLLESFLIYIYRRKNYSFLKFSNSELLDLGQKKEIKKNIYDMIISKIGSLLLYNSDSIIISAIVSTTVSGFYSCYCFIVYGLQLTLTTVYDTLVPKIGQLSLQETKKNQYRNYIIVSLFNIITTSICISGFYLLCKDFILLWVGESALLDERLTIILVINLYISMSRFTSTTFRQAEGLFNKISWLILFRGIFNIILSIILGLKFGLLGIIAATGISDGLTVFWYEPYMILKYYGKKYYFEIIYEILGVIFVIITTLIARKFTENFVEVSWTHFIIKLLIIILVSVICSLIIFGIAFLLYRNNKSEISKNRKCEEEDLGNDMQNNMMNLKFSFILPVYNGAGYVKKAIYSVLNEKNIPLELIVIDDGSTDNTLEVLNSIVNEDSRIKVIHTDNQGQGLARNVGIEAAMGDYIAFIDADDSVIWEGIKQLILLADEKPWDVVCGNYVRAYSNGNIKEGWKGGYSGEITHNSNELYSKIKVRSIFGYCWNKFYRRDFIVNNGILFDNNLKVYMEDTLFNYKVFAHSPTYYYCDVPVYSYSIIDTSDSHKPDLNIANKSIALLNNYGCFLEKYNVFDDNKDLFIPLAMRTFCWSCLKKVLYGKKSVKAVNETVKSFTDEIHFNKTISDKINLRYINHIASFEERLLYKTCFILLNKKKYTLLSLMFLAFYPLFKLYVDVVTIK